MYARWYVTDHVGYYRTALVYDYGASTQIVQPVVMASGTREGPDFPPVDWDQDSLVTLKDILMRHDLPHVAKVVKGQFMNIGVSKFNPLKKLYQDVVIHSIKTGVKILAHSVMRLEGRDGRTTRLVSLEQRLSIPLTYQGWFELLSEDGRSARPIESVLQLAKLYPSVNKVLVRQNIKAYLDNNDGKLTYDKTKIVPIGEQLTLLGDITLPTAPNFDGIVRLLKCTDSKGIVLYLSCDQKGMFTPINSGPDDFTGVFTVKDIVKRFRLPLTIRLVQGVWPKVDTNRFTGIIRLDWVYTDETAFICPTDKHNMRIYPIPTDVSIKLQMASNVQELRLSPAMNTIIIKCNKMVTNYFNTIHLIVSVPETALKSRSHTMANLFSDSKQNIESGPVRSSMKRSKSREDILLDELDDLYGYLREGKQPPSNKFTHDSDEESYWEEPEYAHIDDIRARLSLLENKQPSQAPSSPAKRNSSFVGQISEAIDIRDKRTFIEDTSVQPKIHSNGEVSVMVNSNKDDIPPPVPPRRNPRLDSDHVIHTSVEGSSSPDSGSSRGKYVSQINLQPSLQRNISKASHVSKDSKGSGSGGKSGSSSKDQTKDGMSSGSSSAKQNRKSSITILYL
ncbi:hypothetical protein ACJMK2_040500 [Sinanodonta woodiana]|uniref:CABIT domain-containing protein n=1 Tax=Sinanodonta woodiana TaxID=1069815 RepID=A0ABD3W170_SINWO